MNFLAKLQDTAGLFLQSVGQAIEDTEFDIMFQDQLEDPNKVFSSPLFNNRRLEKCMKN